MTRFLILGAGRQGTACGAFLLERFADAHVTFVDAEQAPLDAARAAMPDQSRAEVRRCDVSADDPQRDRTIAACEVVISCVPFFLNEALTHLALKHRKGFCDLGGNVGVVRRQVALADEARQAGVTLVPDCGIAPGTLNVLAEYWHDRRPRAAGATDDRWTYHSVKLLCGGLPQEPRGALNYQLTFSVHGLLNEYLEDCEVSRAGRLMTVKGLSELETVTDLPLPGTFEAFATSGGASLAPQLYAPQSIDYEYKTLRYPGHRDAIQAMWELGFFDEQPRRVPAGRGQSIDVIPRDVAAILMTDALPSDRRDLVVARAIIEGEHEGRPVRGHVDLLDYADARFTAMERTTGFSIGIVAAHVAGRYHHKPPAGAFVPFQVLPPPLLIAELARAGVGRVTAQVIDP